MHDSARAQLQTHVLQISQAEPLSPTGIDVELGFAGGSPHQPLDNDANSAAAQFPAPFKEPLPSGALAAPGYEQFERERHSHAHSHETAIPALFELVGRTDICNDQGGWGGTDWIKAEKDKINAIKDLNVRDAIFISHVQKEPDLNVRRTKRLLVTLFTCSSNGWSQPRGYWADWVRLDYGTDAGNPRELFKTIDAGILKCRKFVCFLSPEYLKSWACLHELALAAELQKDIVVARVQDVGRISFEDVWKGVEKYEGQINKAEVEAAVNVLTKGLVWHIFDWSQLATGVAEFEKQVGPFLEATDSDYADWDFHARLEVRCSEWLHSSRADKLLLPRDEVESAGAWVLQRLAQPKQRPQPSAEYVEFVAASERKEKRRRTREKQWYMCGCVTWAVVASALVALSIFFLTAKHDAQVHERQARASEARAVAKEREAVDAKLEAQESEARAVQAKLEAQESEARAVQAKLEAQESEAKAVRQLRRAQIGQLMSSVYATTDNPETRLKVAASVVELARATSAGSDFYAMGILNKVINDFSLLVASRRLEFGRQTYWGNARVRALSRDGGWLAASILGDRPHYTWGIMIWDLTSASRRNVTLTSAAEVVGLKFLDVEGRARGRLLVSVDSALTMLVWNLTSLEGGAWDQLLDAPVPLNISPRGPNVVQAFDISPTGASLLLLTVGELWVWDFGASATVTFAAAMADVVPQVFPMLPVVDSWGYPETACYAFNGAYIMVQKQRVADDDLYKLAFLLRNASTGGWELVASLTVSLKGEDAYFAALSPDLQTLAVSYKNKAFVHVWKTPALLQDVLSGTDVLTLQEVTGRELPLVLPLRRSVAELKFSLDGRYLLAWSPQDLALRVWDLYGPHFGGEANPPLMPKVALEARDVVFASFSPASSLIMQAHVTLSAAWFLDTYIWDVSRGVSDGEVVLGREGDLADVAFMPNGHYLASINNLAQEVRFYDAETGRMVGSLPTSPQPLLWGAKVHFSPDSHHCMVVFRGDYKLIVSVYAVPASWDSREEGPTVKVLPLYDAVFSSTGVFLVGLDNDKNEVVAYRMDQLSGGSSYPERTVVYSNNDAIYISDVPPACAPDDLYMAIAAQSWDNTYGVVILVNLPERVGAQVSGPYRTPIILTGDDYFTQLPIGAVAFSPTLENGKNYLVGSTYDNAIIFWDVSQSPPSMAHRFQSQALVRSLAISANGQFLAMGSLLGVEIFELACMGSSKTLPSFTLISQNLGYGSYRVAFHHNTSLTPKLLYGSALGGFHLRTLDTSFMEKHLSSIRSSDGTYSMDVINDMTRVLDEHC